MFNVIGWPSLVNDRLNNMEYANDKMHAHGAAAWHLVDK